MLVSRGLGEPNSIAVDYYNYEVCWADGGRKEMGIAPRIGELIFTELLSTRTVTQNILFGKNFKGTMEFLLLTKKMSEKFNSFAFCNCLSGEKLICLAKITFRQKNCLIQKFA